MDAFPPSYVAVARPLLVLLGLQDEAANASLPKPLNNGAAVNLDSPTIAEDRLVALAQALKKYDSNHVDASPSLGDAAAHPSQSLVFKFRHSSRVSKYVIILDSSNGCPALYVSFTKSKSCTISSLGHGRQ